MTYLARRLILAVPVLLGVSLVVFFALRLAPGDPALVLAGVDADPATVDSIRREYGLDRPLIEQYVVYMQRLVALDLGKSIVTRQPVVRELVARFPTTLMLAVSATAISAIAGIALGLFAAANQRRWVDYAVTLVAMVWLSIPNYVLGVVLILVFAVTLGLLPATGATTPFHYVLPVVTVAAQGIGIIARQTRGSVIDVIREDYMRTARAKGLPERAVLVRHALRNALIPVVTSIGVIFGNLIAGTVIIESVFGIPGLGKLMVDAISQRDYPMVQGTVLLVASTYVFVNLLVDLLYVVIDPRVRLA